MWSYTGTKQNRFSPGLTGSSTVHDSTPCAYKQKSALHVEGRFLISLIYRLQTASGKQQLLQGRVFSAESISKSLYETGLKLAEYRGLLAPDQADARHDFHQRFRRINQRLDEILAIALARAEEREAANTRS